MRPLAGPRLAAIAYKRGFDIDELLFCICEGLRTRGLSLGGLLQSSFGEDHDCADSVMVVDLRSGNAIDIWDRRGKGARGCRLNESRLLEAEPALQAAIAEWVDLLVINRFGRAEGLGRGMVGTIASAIEAGIPLLTAVRPPYDLAWRAFHGGVGCELVPDAEVVLSWASRLGADNAHAPA
jgi:Protein of unknown function (DUF2478)